MIRQSDNLARCARAVLDGTPDDLDPLRAALLAYDAARQDAARLALRCVHMEREGRAEYYVRRAGDTAGPLARVAPQHHDTSTDIDTLAAFDFARRLAAAGTLLALVPLDTLERLAGMSDAPAVLAAKVRQMEAQP